MLRKLMKYELKATARVMLPFYLAVIGLAAVLLLLSLWSNRFSAPDFLALDPVLLVLRLATVAFFAAMVAVPIAAVVLMIVRFKTNLLSDEGYVMFTLPVSAHHLVWSKLLTSAVWFIGAAIVDLLGILILNADPSVFSGIWSGARYLYEHLTAYYAANGVLVLVEVAVVILAACFCECLEFYCPMAIGHSFARHKVLLSVVFYFVIQAVTQAVGVAAVTAGVPLVHGAGNWIASLPPAAAVHGSLLTALLVTVVYGGVLYAITIRNLHRRLNLE